MPTPIGETEQHFWRKVGEQLIKEAPPKTNEQSSPSEKKSALGLIKRLNRFVDDLVTPKGT